MQAQSFQNGLMLWTQWDDRIFVLFADGLSPQYAVVPNEWRSGDPEDDPTLVPPIGFYQPIHGFGVAWRTGSGVRARLGWALAPEISVANAAFQCDSAFKYASCYITNHQGGVYWLKPERSGWQLWVGPDTTP